MKDKGNNADKRENRVDPPVQKNDAPLESVGETIVNYEDTAASPPPGKQIHRRRPLPPVPEKEVKQDNDGEKSCKGD